MKQLVQSVRSGDLKLVEIPTPVIEPTEVLVRTTRSVVSAGTERAVRNLAKAGLVGKARARPDLVKQVIRRARADGISSTFKAVRSRLDDDMPLGYSAAGIAVDVGEYVEGIRPGMRVATGGAGHGEFQVVAGNLCVPIPDGVADDAAAFATVASIALHGLRQADVQIGCRVAVIGLGLVGRLAVRLAHAAGVQVIGLDVAEWPVEQLRAEGFRAHVDVGEDTTRAVLDWTRGHGVDAVLLTAATASSDPIRRAVALLRDRGTLVIVGDVGMELERTPLYEKEVTIRLARSYGPGRYERAYEEWAIDYPLGQVRWTEGRNIEAVLDLLTGGSLSLADLVTHAYPLDEAKQAYETIEGGHGPFVGVQFQYQPDVAVDRAPVAVTTPIPVEGNIGVGLLGAGNFVRVTMMPILEEIGGLEFVAVASAGGTSARHLADRHGFQQVATDARDVINDPNVDLVMIATPHSTHADLVVEALEAGKHVFCEKPLAITMDELDRVEEAHRAHPDRVLMVGFNRRWSPMIQQVKKLLGESGGPLVISYRVNAGALPENHWYKDRREGGRLIGEVCHFIDTCMHIVGTKVTSVQAVGVPDQGSVLSEDLTVLLSFDDGSSASIGYSTGAFSQGPKELIEVLGRGHTVVLEDFRRLQVDGKWSRSVTQDKGHAAQFRALCQGLRAEQGLGAFSKDEPAATSLALVAGAQLHLGLSAARQPDGKI